MKRATRTLTLRTTRWTLIERIAYLNDPYPIPLFKTTYRRITTRNINLLRLRDTSPLHVSVIYQITYIFFFRTNLVISAALETTERSSGTKRREKNENPHLIKWKKERERRTLRMFVKPLSGRRTLAVCPYATWAKIASKKTKPLASEASFVARVLHRVFFS